MIPNRVSAISLFVDDVAASRQFYTDVFGATPINEDDVSVAFRFGDVVINLLHAGSAGEIIAPGKVGARADGARFQLTIWLDNIDAAIEQLKRRGVAFHGPVDRPWGLRTVNFFDPSGHSWEIGQRIAR